MLLKASISITTDPNIMNRALYDGSKIILMSEDVPKDITQFGNMVQATVLLPSYESIAAELDGDLTTSRSLYALQLAQRDCDSYIAVMIAASVKGIPITIYIGAEESSLKFVETFMGYMFYTFGISLCTAASPFVYNPNFDSIVLTKLYEYNLMDTESFILLYPPATPLLNIALQKLSYELNPYMTIRTPEAYANYIYEYIQNVKCAGNKLLTIPATIGGPEIDCLWNSSDPSR